MENLIFYSDISEKLNYNLSLEGANISNSWTRLCLEFENGENLYFTGKINENGDVSIKIPALKDKSGLTGTMKIEVVADNTYFELHKSGFDVKKKVNVSINNTVFESEVIENVKPKVALSFTKEPVINPDLVIVKEPLMIKENQPNPSTPNEPESRFKTFRQIVKK